MSTSRSSSSSSSSKIMSSVVMMLVVCLSDRVVTAMIVPKNSYTSTVIRSHRPSTSLFATVDKDSEVQRQQQQQQQPQQNQDPFEFNDDPFNDIFNDHNNQNNGMMQTTETNQYLKRTRPVNFIKNDTEKDPLSLLQYQQQELSLSLGKLKVSLQQEQGKSQTLEQKLAQAEALIAKQQEQLRKQQQQDGYVNFVDAVVQQQRQQEQQQLLQEELQKQYYNEEQAARLLEQAQLDAQKQQQQLLEKVQQLEIQLQQATQDLSSTKQEFDTVYQDLKRKQQEITTLSKNLESAQTKSMSYQEKMTQLQDNLNAAREKLNIKQGTLTKTQRELAQAKSKLKLQEHISDDAGTSPSSPASSIFGGGFNLGGGIGIGSNEKPSSSVQKKRPSFRSPTPARRVAPRVAPQAPVAAPAKKKVVSAYPIINNWSMNTNTDEITGIVQNHPNIDDGTRIVTSAVLNPKAATSKGAVVTTQSGSKYQLGTPSKPAASYKSTSPPAPPSKSNENNNKESGSAGPSFNFFSGIAGNNNDSSSSKSASSSNNNVKTSSPSSSSPSFQTPIVTLNPLQQQKQRQEQFDLEYPLTGESISNGRGTKYLIAGKSKKKPSGRCEIVIGYKANDDMEPIGDALAIKLSTHKDKLSREYSNYQRIQKNGILGVTATPHAFVKCYDFLPVLEGSLKYAQHSALVLELGADDLRECRAKQGCVDESTVKAALLTAVKCMETVHKARLVYTDLKAENFILMTGMYDVENNNDKHDIVFKGVDLESAIPVKGHPLDYTPEASPPEFAIKYLQGDAYDFVLDYSYDIWSFGMLAYELGSGRSFFGQKSPAQIMKLLGDNFQPPIVDGVIEDEKLRDLITQCLNLDPKKRPSASQIVNHPYFRGGPVMSKLFGW